MKMIDFAKIERKWQKKWVDAKIGESETDKRKKYFFIFAYPGISGFLHVGHMRGYTYSDVITRIKRMQGYNVLFPVGTHASGNQAIAFAEKIKKKDKNWINYLKSNGCSDSQIKKMINPEEIINYFNSVYVEKYWKRFGFLADYRRFTCTSYEDYGKFIEWQFRKLNDKKLLVQKPYFAPVCKIHGPVAVDPSETDISKGGNAEKIEFTLLKFKFKNKFLVAATLRPETVFGQTNLWINTDIEYKEAKVGDETWILSGEAIEKLRYQIKIEDKGYIKENLVGEKAVAPMIDRELMILPSKFIDANVGTGIVTSVPSDAPYDYIALKNLQDMKEADKKKIYGFNLKQIEEIEDIEVIPIIKTEKYGDKAGVKIVEASQVVLVDDPILKELTHEVYKEGFHNGFMLKICGKYSGMRVVEAKEKIKSDMIHKKQAGIMYDLSEEVICRCGEKVFVKRIDDQWFIAYGDKKLKDDTKAHVKNMNIFPLEYHNNISSIIDWFQDRACTRLGNWTGTKLQFNKEWIIQRKSDSTLYPIYYLVSKYVNSKELKASQMGESFFDYIYLGKGDLKKVAKENKIDARLLEKIKSDVEYYYPLDMNLGGKEHQTVHFPVFLMNHVAILDKKDWPLGIFVNWWVTGKGGKISKSKGGAESIRSAIDKYSVDAMRLYYCHVGSANSDIVWDEDEVFNYRNSVKRVYDFISNIKTSKNNKKMIDTWIESRINSKIKKALDATEKHDIRNYTEIVFFGIFNDMKKYINLNNNADTVKYCVDRFLSLIAPICPHIAEELWSNLGHNSFISLERLPKVEENKINEEIEKIDSAIEKTVDDVQNILKIVRDKTGKEGSRVYLYVLPKELENYDSKVLSARIGKIVEIYTVNDKKKYDPPGASAKAKPGRPGIFVE